jgi:Fic family protein
MQLDLSIIPTDLAVAYKSGFNPSLSKDFDALVDSELSVESCSFFISVSAVFSSKIEGEEMDLEAFTKHKRFGAPYQPDYTRKIDDLYNAYLLAQQNRLTPQTLALVHAQLTQNILQPSQQGMLRTGNMFVVTPDGKIEYAATAPANVAGEMEKLYADIYVLLNTNLAFADVCFFAALLHLVFVKFHPFQDGNGRTARLLE